MIKSFFYRITHLVPNSGLFILLSLILLCGNVRLYAQSGINIRIDESGIEIEPDQFINYYQAPTERLSWLAQQSIPQVQWPLLFEIAQAANVSIDQVWDLRRQRDSWLDVLSHYNVSPSYFYYDLPDYQQLAPPYGKAYGYYKKHPEETARWSDADLISLSSVRYISESTKRSPRDAIAAYNSQPQFIRSNNKHVESSSNSSKKHKKQGEVHVKKEKHEKANKSKKQHVEANAGKSKHKNGDQPKAQGKGKGNKGANKHK